MYIKVNRRIMLPIYIIYKVTYKDYIYLISPIKLPIKINIYIYFIDILWFFIKQNKKKKV
jgi:hypothetical protein